MAQHVKTVFQDSILIFKTVLYVQHSILIVLLVVMQIHVIAVLLVSSPRAKNVQNAYSDVHSALLQQFVPTACQVISYKMMSVLPVLIIARSVITKIHVKLVIQVINHCRMEDAVQVQFQ